MEGLDKLKALKQQYEATAAAGAAPAAAGAAPQPAVAAANADSPLGPHGALLGLISNSVLAGTSATSQVLLAGLRSEASKGEHEAAWKAAGLALYQRRGHASAGLVTATFEQAWAAAVDHRLDARVIAYYARLSDAPAFLQACQGSLFGDCSSSADKEKSHFSEVELRDYYQLAYGDNVVRIQDAKGTAVWWRRKWKWDKTDKTLQYLVLRAVRDLYHDLLTQHRDRRTAVEDNANGLHRRSEEA